MKEQKIIATIPRRIRKIILMEGANFNQNNNDFLKIKLIENIFLKHKDILCYLFA